MKNLNFFLSLLLVVPLLVNVYKTSAQIQYGGDPFVVEAGLKNNQTSLHSFVKPLSPVQMEEREMYSDYITPPGEAMHAGFSVPVNINPLTHGEWEVYGDTLRLWRVMIKSPEANGIGLTMQNFQLSESAKIFIYDPELSFVLGSFDQRNNNDLQVFSSQLIPGDALIVEYQERIASGESQKMINSSFFIEELFHVTQGLTDFSDSDKNLGNAGPCMVNINCSEGDMWQRQKRGVARMLMRVGSSLFWCSGSLVNNALNDGTPFFLTAAHCGSNASPGDYALWQFYFNFERPICDNSGTPYHNVLYGADLLMDNPILEGSDFKLLYLHQVPPKSFQPYYNGWNRMDEASPFGVGIHHPAGDAKKISTYTQPVTTASPVVSGQQMAENSTWRVVWSETENGHSVVQGGSSGSPLFNPQGLIVGTLTGGSSSCNNTNNPDFYGKMSHHWDQSPDAFEHINFYLDPLNSGVEYIFGFDPYQENYPPPGFLTAKKLENDHVEIKWLKPGQTPNNPGWYTYSNSFHDFISSGPQRATLFHAGAFGFSYPVTITKLSHTFMQNPSLPWASNEFQFKIYDHTGYQLMYVSPVLEAESLVEFIYELSMPVTFENKFYVAVDPVHSSGNPASVYQLMNYGHGVSFFGAPDNWNLAGNNDNQYVYLSKIYVEDHTNQHEDKLKIISPDDFTGLDKIQSKWANSAFQYNIFKNGVFLDTFHANDENELTFTDEEGQGEGPYDTYFITAIYPEGIESAPSNTVYLFHDEFCQENISEFPWLENFDAGELPGCWASEGQGQGWQFSSGYTVSNMEIEPQDDNHFVYLHLTEDDNGGNWLITPPFDLSEPDKPALYFWFNSSYAGSNSSECFLELYASTDDGSFNKIWDAGQHPFYKSSNAYTWIQNVEDLGRFRKENVRLAFRMSCQTEAFAALDNIEIKDAADNTYRVLLSMHPENTGEVYGAGRFIEGQKVTVEGWPKAGYYFHNWLQGGEIISWRQEYSFIMPGNELSLTAFFDTTIPVSVNDYELTTDEITIFPNPSRGLVNVSFPADITGMSLQVFNTSGHMVYNREESFVAGQSMFEIDFSSQPRGLYLVVVSDGNTRQVKKVNIIR
ncbi:MAG: T9SS C-terminal target domain-containing protein [Bacteroidetes bacterium]|nr:MAG: T9SS C-terminal target domain-containing protein [Bacteroidota bacterium]